MHVNLSYRHLKKLKLTVFFSICRQIKTMKELYLPELHELYQKIAGKLQQVRSHFYLQGSVKKYMKFN